MKTISGVNYQASYCLQRALLEKFGFREDGQADNLNSNLYPLPPPQENVNFLLTRLDKFWSMLFRNLGKFNYFRLKLSLRFDFLLKFLKSKDAKLPRQKVSLKIDSK